MPVRCGVPATPKTRRQIHQALNGNNVTIAKQMNTLTHSDTLDINGVQYHYQALPDELRKLPYALKVFCENASRNGLEDLGCFKEWLANGGHSDREINFYPSRVLIHDMNCVPAIADFAALRNAVLELGGDPARVNPKIPVDIVVDHSTIVDFAGAPDSFDKNLRREFERNDERFKFIRWAQASLSNVRVVPPGTGILHQINLEHLSDVVRVDNDAQNQLRLTPDSLVGTDSHTPMINAIGVVGWGVGGIEAQSAALGEALVMKLPDVVGVRFTGTLGVGVTATDLALTVTHRLRKLGVVDKVVEFFGPGLASLSAADRAVISNMAPEYGALLSMFPIDDRTLAYLSLVGQSPKQVDIVRAYAQAQGLWREEDSAIVYTEIMDIDLAGISTTLAGPKRPQDRMNLDEVPGSFLKELLDMSNKQAEDPRRIEVPGKDYALSDGAVLIAAITSCTNTSNPDLMIAAGLMARNAYALGLRTAPGVKTSLSPGSLAVSDYLAKSGLQEDLDRLGFQLTGFGCMTCCGNSGPLDPAIDHLVRSQQLVGAAVLSGNRNFENRVHSSIRAAYLASPPLVVAYAIAGSVLKNLATEPVGTGANGQAVWLKDIWPTQEQVDAIKEENVTRALFQQRFRKIFDGPPKWQEISVAKSSLWPWEETSTYIKHPPYFQGVGVTPTRLADIDDARVLAVLGDSITTDHISPVGSIDKDSLAGKYLSSFGVAPDDFNQFGTRRGNHEVMMRGVYSNPRLRNELLAAEDVRGGVTRIGRDGPIVSIFDAAQRYRESATPLIVIAGKEYGTGSSRDWAAKGPQLIGVRAIVAESFERIHRINLIGTGVLPLQFMEGITRHDLAIDGSEVLGIQGLDQATGPRAQVSLVVHRCDGQVLTVPVMLRAETDMELSHLHHGGLLPHVLRDFFR
jgi:aconitate hydratase